MKNDGVSAVFRKLSFGVVFLIRQLKAGDRGPGG